LKRDEDADAQGDDEFLHAHSGVAQRFFHIFEIFNFFNSRDSGKAKQAGAGGNRKLLPKLGVAFQLPLRIPG
jgi:hypothetical protein